MPPHFAFMDSPYPHIVWANQFPTLRMKFTDVRHHFCTKINAATRRFWINRKLTQTEAALEVCVHEVFWDHESGLSRRSQHFRKVYHSDEAELKSAWQLPSWRQRPNKTLVL
jgi:hypothetical protein